MDLKNALSKKNIKQMDVAAALKVSQQMASMIINGKRKVPIKKMKDFEKLTGLSRQQFRPELYR